MIPTCSRIRSRDRCTRKDPGKLHWHTAYSTGNSFPSFAPSSLDPIESRSWRAVAGDAFLPILCRPNNLRFLLRITLIINGSISSCKRLNVEIFLPSRSDRYLSDNPHKLQMCGHRCIPPCHPRRHLPVCPRGAIDDLRKRRFR